MMIHLISLWGVLWLGFSGPADTQETVARKTLERLRGLAGDWVGTLEWSGARTGGGRIKATYSVTGNGSAVIESLIMDGETDPSMTSVYHLDGSDLRMTHYCGAQNQPRLKASKIAEDGSVIQFSFVDATDLTAHPAHVSALEIRFLPDERLGLQFTFENNGKTSVERIDLERTRRGSLDGRGALEPLRQI